MWKNVILSLPLAIFSFFPSLIHGIPFRVFEEDRLDASIDVLLVQRKGVSKKILAEDQSSGESVINSHQLMNRFHWRPGVKAAICYTPSVARSIEISAMWVAKGHGKVTRCGDNNLRFPFDAANFTEDYSSAWRVRGSYSSQLWDFEGNYWEHMTPRGGDYFSVSWIAGLRGIYLGEYAHAIYSTSIDTSHYSGTTHNRLFGAQAGLCLQINPGPCGPWSFDLIPKGGILGNWIHAASRLGDQNNAVVIREVGQRKIRWAYLLDGDMRLSYHPRHGLAHIGYRLLGIWNIDLATSQLSTSTDYHRAAEARNWRAFYHIFYLGFDWIF